YSELGKRAEALPPTQESVTIYQGLAEQNPAFLPDLAMSLNNLGNRYSQVGRDPQEAWREAVSDSDGKSRALLQFFRLRYAEAGHVEAPGWLIDALRQADDPGIVAALHAEGRRHRLAGPDKFDLCWTEVTGKATPGWLALDPALVESAEAWRSTPTYHTERDHLLAHPELLPPESEPAVAEALLGLDDQEVNRYRTLLQLARERGVAEAYAAFLSTLSEPAPQEEP
ncbi:Tetratricopeptide repeat-containing protein, partial [Tessaracoccus bendigoensis DSM 12906]